MKGIIQADDKGEGITKADVKDTVGDLGYKSLSLNKRREMLDGLSSTGNIATV